MRKKIYLATSYSYTGKWGWIPGVCKLVEYVRNRRVTKALAKLMVAHKDEVNIFSPITHSHPVGRLIPDRLNTHTLWLGIDFEWIDVCDEMWIFMQPGWCESYGVTEEIKYCESKDIPIRYIEMDTLFVTHLRPICCEINPL